VNRALRQAPLAHRRQALEARFGLRVASALAEQGVSHDVEQRLRVAREQALSRAAAVRQTRLGGASSVLRSGGAAVLGRPGWWQRLGALAPIVVLALGFLLVEYIDDTERIRAAAEIDAVLLSDTVPPGAYADPGFGEYLRQAPP
jgi:hypothetical protein